MSCVIIMSRRQVFLVISLVCPVKKRPALQTLVSNVYHMAHLQRALTQHSSTNLKNGIHISTYYMSLLSISTYYDWAMHVFLDPTYFQACILVHPSLKIRLQTVLYSDSIPLAIITLLRIITYYYVLLRIFLPKCCFMMSFAVFTHYYVLMLAGAGDPFSGRSIIGRNKH